MDTLQRILIWDLPTRIFHWLLVLAFIAIAVIVFVLGDDSSFFPYHALLGIVVILMVALRILWGFIGTHHARFSSFTYSLHSVVAYLKTALHGKGHLYAGHNPGSSWAIFAMIIFFFGLAVTGFLLGRRVESVKEIHEYLAWGMLVTAVIHIAGILLHTIRNRENISASMIHGYKSAKPEEAILSSQPLPASVFLLVVAAWTYGVLANYNPQTGSAQLPIVGIQLSLTDEAEDNNEEEQDDSDDKDDDD